MESALFFSITTTTTTTTMYSRIAASRLSPLVLRLSQRTRSCVASTRSLTTSTPTPNSTSGTTSGSNTNPAASLSPPPPPLHTNGNNSRLPAWRWFLQTLGRVTLIVLVTGAGTFYYITQKDRHPGEQLPHDSSKKSIVILGSGWAATSLLKNINTEAFNVTVISPKNFFLFTPLLPSVAVGTVSPR